MVVKKRKYIKLLRLKILIMADKDREFDPLDTRTDIGPLEKADACFHHALKHLDLSTRKGRIEAQDTVNRAMILYDMANRPDMVMEVMRYAGIIDPMKDKRLYIKTIVYHKQQYKTKEKEGIRGVFGDYRSPEEHMKAARKLAEEINLESVLLDI